MREKIYARTKKRTVWLLAVTFVLSIIALLLVLGQNTVKSVRAAEILGDLRDVSVTPDVAAPDSVEEAGRKGILVSGQANGAAFSFANEFAGKFELTFRLLPDEAGESTFNMFTLELADVEQPNKTLSFHFEYSTWHPSDKTPSNSVLVTGGGVQVSRRNSFAFDGSKSEITVCFDADASQVILTANGKTETLIDYDDADFMYSHFGSHYPIDFTMERFTVRGTFNGLVEPGTTDAEVLLYSVNGQSLSGATPENQTGADVAGQPQFDAGVAGEAYTVNTDNLYQTDVLDGLQPFTGDVTITAPDGKIIELGAERTFTPDAAGTYVVDFTARDSEGISGESLRAYLKVLPVHPPIAIDFRLPMQDMETGVGGSVDLYPATGKSLLSETPYPVTVTVEKDGRVLDTFENIDTTEWYAFTDSGSYTIVYRTDDERGQSTSLSFTVKVYDLPGLQIDDTSDTYTLNEQFDAPFAFAEGAQTKYTLEFPSGKRSGFPTVKLTETGVYTMRYTVTKGTESYTYIRKFAVDITGDALFTCTKDMKATANSVAPDYMDVRRSGVMLSSAMVNSEATYVNALNITGRTADDLLIETYVTPSVKGELQLGKYTIKIADAVDPSVYITATFTTNPYNYRNLTGITTAYGGIASTMPKAVWLDTTLYGKYEGGTDGTYRYISEVSTTTRLYWDDAEKALYASPVGESKVLVTDFDDPTYAGANIFGGFPSGKVKISIIFDTVAAQANMLVMNVGGQSLEGEIISDTTSPELTVSDIENGVPVGWVNVPYPVFDAVASDFVSGTVDDVLVRVYYGENRIAIRSDNTFLPDKAGDYTIIYTAADKSGNTRAVSVTVSVVEPENGEDLSISDVDYASVELGESIEILPVSVTGGSGRNELTVCVSLDGQILAEFDTPNGQIFVPEKNGDYVITYRAYDRYIDQSTEESYTVKVGIPDGPQLHEVVLFDAVLVGKTYSLPVVTATDWTSGTASEANVVTQINGTPLEDETNREICMENPGTFELSYVATDALGRTNTLRKTVIVIDPTVDNGQPFLSRYLLMNTAAEISAEVSSMTFKTEQEATYTFINMLPASNFSFRFAVPNDSSDYSTIRITLQDSVNVAERLELVITKNSDTKSYISVNGGGNSLIAGAFNENATAVFDFRYDGQSLYDAEGTEIYLGGFGGFSSNRVYLTFETDDLVSGKAGIKLMSICNQPFTLAPSDTIKPMILTDDNYQRDAKIGERFYFPEYTAFDVLDPYTELFITVLNGSKTLLDNVPYEQGMYMDITEGGNYSIEVHAYDSSRRREISYFSLMVIDDTVPTIRLEEHDDQAEVGKTVMVARPVTTGAETCYIIVYRPDGQATILDETRTFTPEIKGTYRILYFAVSAFDITATTEYDLTVR